MGGAVLSWIIKSGIVWILELCDCYSIYYKGFKINGIEIERLNLIFFKKGL